MLRLTDHSKRRIAERGFKKERIDGILNRCGYPEYRNSSYHYVSPEGIVIVVQGDRVITVYHRK